MDFIIDNIILVVLALGSAGVLVWPSISKRINKVSELSALEVVQVMNRGKTVIVDMRLEAEFKKGHLIGSKNIPEGSLDERIGELEKFKTKNLVLVGSSNAKAVTSLMILRKKGFADINILSGGLNAWQQANLPMEKTE